MNMLRSLRDDDRGEAPFVVIAAVAVFIIISAGLASLLIASIQSSATIQVNSSVAEAATSSARFTAGQGYTAAALLPAQEDIEFNVGDLTVPAIRTVEVNEATRTARVTVTAGQFNGTSFTNPEACTAASRCIIASELISGWLR